MGNDSGRSTVFGSVLDLCPHPVATDQLRASAAGIVANQSRQRTRQRAALRAGHRRCCISHSRPVIAWACTSLCLLT